MAEEPQKQKEECLELKNIKYQTMLLNNNTKIYETTPNTSNIEKFLERELEANNNKPWTKLGKGTKLKKINEFIIKYSVEKKYNEEQKKKLKRYLLSCLERKKLQKTKDVVYCTKTNTILSIPALTYNDSSRKFTLRKNEKKTPKNNNSKNKTNKIRGKKKSKIDKNIKE
tara:strand:- start:3793 stop:4302 length:510 start_codon:yes stop_codon:yes gene_type:complete